MAKTAHKSIFSQWQKPLKSQCSPNGKNRSEVNVLPMAKTTQKSMFSQWQNPLKSQCSPNGKNCSEVNVLPMAMSLKAILSIPYVSGAVFLNSKPNLMQL
jgi:hypothetical protein